MIYLTNFESVNFYGDPIEVAFTDGNEPYVSVAQITGYLGLDIDAVLEQFDNDPRVNITMAEDAAVIQLTRLNGFLMLLDYKDIPDEFREDLLRYQTECFQVLHDYWLHGAAINRRETPFDITSKFKDERAVSRVALTKACADYCNGTDTDPSDLFDKLLGRAYKVVGIEPLHENEKLTGTEAQYLAWVESVFAKVVGKFAKWGESFEDVTDAASGHVETHLRETGMAWMAMADNMPASAYES